MTSANGVDRLIVLGVIIGIENSEAFFHRSDDRPENGSL
jgi:hypothetical protein